LKTTQSDPVQNCVFSVFKNIKVICKSMTSEQLIPLLLCHFIFHGNSLYCTKCLITWLAGNGKSYSPSPQHDRTKHTPKDAIKSSIIWFVSQSQSMLVTSNCGIVIQYNRWSFKILLFHLIFFFFLCCRHHYFSYNRYVYLTNSVSSNWQNCVRLLYNIARFFFFFFFTNRSTVNNKYFGV
jgi:hypothetical protein